MFHTFRHLKSIKTTTKVFWVSFLVFAVLNAIENVIHYSIGRDRNRNALAIRFQRPSAYDMVRILGVMAVFAVLQATLTCYFLQCSAS